MGAQFDHHLVVNVRPFWVMVQLAYFLARPNHEIDGLFKTIEFKGFGDIMV